MNTLPQPLAVRPAGSPFAMSAGTATNPAVAPMTLPTMQPAAPATQALAFTEAPVQQASGCTMNARVTLETRAVIELPWGIFSDKFYCAFIGKAGQLVVSENAPRFDTISDDWVVDGESIQFGVVSSNYEHWRTSLTFRPDYDEEEEDDDDIVVVKTTPVYTAPVTTVPEPEPVPEVVVPRTPVFQPIDTSRMSRRERKAHASRMAARGLNPDGSDLSE